MTDKPTNEPTEPTEPTDPIKSSGPADLLEERLAAYGAVLREEVDKATGTIAGIDTADAGETQDLGFHERGAGTAPTRREQPWRTGVLVAAVLALIAGVGVFSLSQNDAGTRLQVSAEPTSAPSPVTDATGDGDFAGEENKEADAEAQAGDGTGDRGETVADKQTDPQADFQADSDQGEGGQPAEAGDESGTGPELVCEVGVLRGSVCVVLGDPPLPDAGTCPVTGTVFEDAQGCYTIVPILPTCDGLVIHDEDNCRVPVDRVPAPLECPEGFGVRSFDQTCIRPGTASTICVDATIEDRQCVLVGPAPVTPLSSCPAGADIVEQAGTCYRIESTSCGELTPAPNGQCRQPGAVVNADECASSPDLGIVDGQCTTSSPGALSCDGAAVLEGNECVRNEQFEEEECPVSATVILQDGECFMIVETLPDGTCEVGQLLPDGSGCLEFYPGFMLPECFGTPVVDPVTGHDLCQFRDPASLSCEQFTPLHPTNPTTPEGQCVYLVGPPTVVTTCSATGLAVNAADDCFTLIAATCSSSDCRTQVQPITAPAECGSGYQLRSSDNTCVRLLPPRIQCVEGDLDSARQTCIVTADTLGGGPACPVSDVVNDDGVSCFRLQPRAGCGDYAEVAGGCRVPVPLRAGPLRCQAGYGIVNGDCLRYEAPAKPA